MVRNLLQQRAEQSRRVKMASSNRAKRKTLMVVGADGAAIMSRIATKVYGRRHITRDDTD
jgi:hypothetical protein